MQAGMLISTIILGFVRLPLVWPSVDMYNTIKLAANRGQHYSKDVFEHCGSFAFLDFGD